MTRTLSLIGLALITFFSLRADAADAPGWEGYPSLSEMNDLAVFDGSVYAVGLRGMVRYDPDSETYTYFYPNSGLQQKNIRTIAAGARYLYLGFEQDGLMRFDPARGTFEPILFPEYVSHDGITPSIPVNDIVAASDTILYVAHGHGIDRLNLVTEELRAYTHLSAFLDVQTPVVRIAVFDAKVWACTQQGLAWGGLDDPNLESPSAWKVLDPDGTGVNAVAPVADSLGNPAALVGTGAGIFNLNPETFVSLPAGIAGVPVTDIADGFGTVVVSTAGNGIYVKSGAGWVNDRAIANVNRLVPDGAAGLWLATARDGIRRRSPEGYAAVPAMNLPVKPSMLSLTSDPAGTVWIATANRDFGGGSEILRFRNGTWSSLADPKILRTNAVLADTRGTTWGAAWGDGLNVIDDRGTETAADDVITPVDPAHEFFLPYQGTGTFVVLPDVAEDDAGNIWAAGFDSGVYVMDGSLPIANARKRQFTLEGTGVAHLVMMVEPDPDGWLWAGTWETGLIAVKTGADPYSGPGTVTHIAGGGAAGELLGTRVYAAGVDESGDVWVGTNGGLNRIEKRSGDNLAVFDESELLGSQAVEVYSIEIGSDDTKWIGTSAGLFRINRENKLVAAYTLGNSGLLSDMVLSLQYEPDSGNLLVGTDAGLNVFDTREGGAGQGNEAYVYPNPFPIWGTGARAVFGGLSAKPLRIYTFNGELVTELDTEPVSAGEHQAVWDGRNARGEMVGTGVFIFSGEDMQGRAFSKKLAVIRR